MLSRPNEGQLVQKWLNTRSLRIKISNIPSDRRKTRRLLEQIRLPIANAPNRGKTLYRRVLSRHESWANGCDTIFAQHGRAVVFSATGLERHSKTTRRTKLRMYFLQRRFSLSDPAVEEVPYDMISMRAFARIDLGNPALPTRPRSASSVTSSRSTT
jgi:hypothetical protein